MNQTNKFQQLIKRASQEQPPDIDVSQLVFKKIRQRPITSNSRDPLPWCAGLSLTSAAIILLAFYSTWDTFQDPLMFLVEPIRLALP